MTDATEPHPYVGHITAPMTRIAGLMQDRVVSGALSPVSRLGVWLCIMSHVMDRFVEGVSRVPKCSVPGRGLMSLDAGSIYLAGSKVAPTIPSMLPRDRGWVDTYISAFYLDGESELLQWMMKNKAAYSLRHVRAIIMHGFAQQRSVKKKQVAELMAAVESMYLLPPAPATGGSSAASAVDRSAALAASALSFAGFSSYTA